MISKQTKAQVKALLTNPHWRAVEEVANELCAKIQGQSVIQDTEWETLKATLLREGEERGIRRLLHELQNQIADL
mgnify:CR=1 FL=1